ncbi:MAG: hypothetical protein RL318_68 [Fibrobacterota bacterium]|jgi:hypothetical protein
MKKDERNHCPVCGWNGLTVPAYANLAEAKVDYAAKPPYAALYGEPSFEMCLCCGYEFGYHDDPESGKPVSFSEHLKNWMAEGTPWYDDAREPGGWRIQDQLRGKGIPEPGRAQHQQKAKSEKTRAPKPRHGGIENE